ncbi:MAG TPA: hypothetical protein VFM63_14575 [Pyrinomonadaceae bacterium]|nr:hypothetical protein [Pyrinomonadaceae bacterium]
MRLVVVNACRVALSACLIVFTIAPQSVSAQRKSKKKPATAAPAPVNELTKLRDEYVKTTNEYKSSLEKLISIYETNVKKAEDKLDVSKKLLDEGLISKVQFEEYELALKGEREKLEGARRQMTEADAQIAAMLVETEAEKTISKNLRLARQSLVRTTAFTRYTGSGSGWNLGEAYKIQRFFSDTFNKQLPVAVFGQGPIHDRWRLDHRNAMDISLHPDSAEGQALLNFLQKNGIPYLAFRSAIPGTATGPHIHIGRPSHRY